MKQFAKTTFPFVAAVLFTACGNNNEGTAAKEADQHNPETTQKAEATAQPGSVRLKEENLNAVYQHYIHLTTALTNSDAAEAKVAATAIETGARGLQNGNTIAATAAKISVASDIEKQRAAYEDLSKQMMEKVKAAGVQNGQLYVQHCPMAFNNKGASWLSSTSEIRNPYFGEKMLKCGETKEIIQ
jgi:hypothetical protein